MYNRVPAFRTSFDSTLQLQVYTGLKQTGLAFSDCDKQTSATEKVNFISKPGVFFSGVQQNDFMNSYISCGMAHHRCVGFSF